MASPPGVEDSEEFIEAADRQRLFLRAWRPHDPPRAALAIVHGFNAHSAYYERFANVMAGRGIAVYALDLRGHGKSSCLRFEVEQFSDYVNDVDAMLSRVREREPARPVFMLGHGAGGVAAGVYALAHQQHLAGLICESLALEIGAPAVLLRGIGALAALAPRLPVLRLRNAGFSRDEEVVRRMHDDPLIRKERQSARTVAAMVRANALLRASLSQLSLPLLILHGSADTVAMPSGSEYLHEHAGSRDKTLQVFEDYYHDLINDQGHEHVVERIHQWIEARLSAADRTQIGIAYINTNS